MQAYAKPHYLALGLTEDDRVDDIKDEAVEDLEKLFVLPEKQTILTQPMGERQIWTAITRPLKRNWTHSLVAS